MHHGLAAGGSGRRILMVEGNHDAAESMARLLEFYGHDVRTVRDGPGALAAVHRWEPHAVLMELAFAGGQNGCDVAREIRADDVCGHALIIALTGYNRTVDRQEAEEAGFNHYLVKPLMGDGLETLLSLIDGTASRDAAPCILPPTDRPGEWFDWKGHADAGLGITAELAPRFLAAKLRYDE